MKTTTITITVIIATLIALGCAEATPPPPIENPRELAPARMEMRSGRLTVTAPSPESPGVVPVESRSFRDRNELMAFAEKELGARPVFDDAGRMIAIQGDLVQAGDVVFRDADGTFFSDNELVAAYLGGADGKLRVGGEVLDLHAIDTASSVEILALLAETCDGDDCISGETWLTHRLVYHSVGGRTRQTRGGDRTVSYQCCTSGLLVTHEGRRQCRHLRPGAWEYDPDLGILVPTDVDPYVFTEPRTCSRRSLSNRLRVDLKLIFGPNQFLDLSREESNTREVEIKRWLITFGLDAGTDFVQDVVGVCGFHSSNRGGFVRTDDGFTGDDDVLCQG